MRFFFFFHQSAMTSVQVKQAESIAREMIDKNEIVYAKESPLSMAKAVKGLRAVFDETYPDPVRVVSIGVPVDDLLQDPSSPAGMNTSIEFCGGTHLKRSGHIGDFVITSEEAIAKGIRRIVCVTGPEATRSINKLAELEKLAFELGIYINANQSKFSTELKNMAKKVLDLQQKVSASDISCWKKEELRNTLNQLKKQLDNYERSLKASQVNEVVNVAKQLATDNPKSKYMVNSLNAGSNAKALDQAVKAARAINPDLAVLFFSIDSDNNKIICLSNVSKEIAQKGLTANEWVQNITTVIQGKGGGKQESAQAIGNNIGSLDEAIKLSNEFARLKLGD